MARNNRTLVTVSLTIGLATASIAPGATFKSGPQPTVAADEVIDDDLYVTGERVTIDGVIRGDLIAAGREIFVNGTVEGDLVAAGQAVVVNGTVEDARIAGMALKLGDDANVTQDLFGFAFSLESTSDSMVRSSVFFTGYQALLAGTIGGALTISSGALELAGTVAGDVEAEITGTQDERSPARFMPSPLAMPSVDGGLRIADSAMIQGTLTYTADTEGAIAPDAAIAGGVEHRHPEVNPEQLPTTATRVLGLIKKPVALLITGMMLLWLAPAWVHGLVENLEARPVKSLAWGVVSLVGFPIAVIAILLVGVLAAILFGILELGDLVLLVIVGMLLGEGALAATFWVAVAFLAPIAVGLVAGRWMVRRVQGGVVGGGVFPLVIGIVVVAVLCAVPVVGTLVAWLVVLLGLGALANVTIQHAHRRRST